MQHNFRKSYLTAECIFCGKCIEPNYYNCCDECLELANDNPEQFIDDFLTSNGLSA